MRPTAALPGLRPVPLHPDRLGFATMAIARSVLNRLLLCLGLVLAVVVLNFVLVHAAPGDPVSTIAGVSGGMSPELMAQLRTQYGLDKPLPVQLGVYLGKVVRGDLGYSYFFNLPVSSLILERLPATLLLVLSSVLAAFVIGTALGVLSARKPNGVLSQFITVLSMVGFAAPVFWTGIMLVLLFALVIPILPVAGRDVHQHEVQHHHREHQGQSLEQARQQAAGEIHRVDPAT